MKQIGSLFDKYRKTLRPPQATVEKKALFVIKGVVGIDLREDQLSYSTGTKTLRINVPSIVKSELFRRKSEILLSMRDELGEASAPTELI